VDAGRPVDSPESRRAPAGNTPEILKALLALPPEQRKALLAELARASPLPGLDRPALECEKVDPPPPPPPPAAASVAADPAPTDSTLLRPSTAPSDDVHFGASAPASVEPRQSFVLDVWAFGADERALFLDRVREESPEPMRIKTQGPARIVRGSVIEVHLALPSLEIAGGARTLLWSGAVAKATFAVTVPESARMGTHLGVACFTARGGEVGALDFAIEVGRARPARVNVARKERRRRTGFASYANRDRAQVQARVQGIESAGVRVFVDVADLRAGQLYEQVLEREIVQRDVFYLFWSRAASRSRWVEREWRLALRTKGVEAIDPIPLVSPRKVPPPAELADKLHFDDRWVAFQEYDSASRARWWQVWKSWGR
jgi:hypothetical protein